MGDHSTRQCPTQNSERRVVPAKTSTPKRHWLDRVRFDSVELRQALPAAGIVRRFGEVTFTEPLRKFLVSDAPGSTSIATCRTPARFAFREDSSQWARARTELSSQTLSGTSHSSAPFLYVFIFLGKYHVLCQRAPIFLPRNSAAYRVTNSRISRRAVVN